MSSKSFLEPPRRAVEAILAAQHPMALAATGGGSLAINWLVGHPGASRAVVEAQIPYHEASLRDYLGDAGPHPAAQETARRMACVAAQRAARISGVADVLGVGVTAALATTRERRGEDRAHLAVRRHDRYWLRHLAFPKQGGDRHAQEDALSRALIDLLALALGTGGVELPDTTMIRHDRQLPVNEAIEALIEASVDAIELSVEGSTAAPSTRDRLLVSGSFNPLHEGHRGLLTSAAGLCGRGPALELSILNVDKPPLDYAEVVRRWTGVRDEGWPLVMTREPTFDGKARLFPGCHFAIGFDTAVRVIAPRYYGSQDRMEAALDALLAGGTLFYVAGRMWEGTYRGLGTLDVPERYRSLFVEIPEASFRADISSTELRQRSQGT